VRTGGGGKVDQRKSVLRTAKPQMQIGETSRQGSNDARKVFGRGLARPLRNLAVDGLDLVGDSIRKFLMEKV